MSKEINGEDLIGMFFAGSASLSAHEAQVDAMNVFPVPDGDTGTNMNMSMNSGVLELRKNPSDHAGRISQTLSKGLLMGARGNSGVILSQLFRGFSRAIVEDQTVSAKKLAEAFSRGVVMAYDAVMRPVEGTILTVAKEAAAEGERALKHTDDPIEVMRIVLEAAEASLMRTPDLLPVLKEVGVVDSGGQGLVYIYKGFYAALRGEAIQQDSEELTPLEYQEERAQIHLESGEIEYGYCTEFLIKQDITAPPFLITPFREKMSRYGDSLLVVSDDEWIKIHVHSEHPGQVLEYGQQFGELVGIKIENMREQHANILNATQDLSPEITVEKDVGQLKYGVVAVASGKGMSDILKSLGVNQVVEGGQSMNPSTDDLLQAASSIQAQHLVFLPNNKNIIMAAEQAARLAEVPATVVPSRSIPQGMAAMLALRSEESVGLNQQLMTDAISQVKTGQVTYAVRDATVDQVEIKKGEFMGLFDGEIINSGLNITEVCIELLKIIIDEQNEIITIFYGQEIESEEAQTLYELTEKAYPDMEVELHQGGQPLYSYVFSVE